jgi:hypothetical protein
MAIANDLHVFKAFPCFIRNFDVTKSVAGDGMWKGLMRTFNGK